MTTHQILWLVNSLIQAKLEAYKTEEQCSHLIVKAALVLHDSIKSGCTKEQLWPPNPKELDDHYGELPSCLIQFLRVLLGGDQAECTPSDPVNRLAWSMRQYVLTAVSNGKILTSEHILLPWAVKTLTGNVELIKILNCLGHSCSYTKLEEVDTALCNEKIRSTSCEFTLPSGTRTHLCEGDIKRIWKISSHQWNHCTTYYLIM